MERGWDAKGLLRPLWGRVGGRDALAALTGIAPQTLSGYNTGNKGLGLGNARRIADALDVSVLELGAPVALVDDPGESLLGRLEELSELVALGFETLGLDVDDLRRLVDARARKDAQDGGPE